MDTQNSACELYELLIIRTKPDKKRVVLLVVFSAYVENFMVFNSLNTIVAVINIIAAIAFISFAIGFGRLIKSITNV